ncbi:hypothetical protein GJ496_008426 [Pomphorhynchus laevis]|nr:hypothetical protein GJ496_008426 [Pomphorhynchus laevis]
MSANFSVHLDQSQSVQYNLNEIQKLRELIPKRVPKLLIALVRLYMQSRRAEHYSEESDQKYILDHWKEENKVLKAIKLATIEKHHSLQKVENTVRKILKLSAFIDQKIEKHNVINRKDDTKSSDNIGFKRSRKDSRRQSTPSSNYSRTDVKDRSVSRFASLQRNAKRTTDK